MRKSSACRPKLAALAAFGVLAMVAGISSGVVDAALCWFPPVDATVSDPFREPPCRWCAGHRGLEYDVGDDIAVRAAASGRVEFVGIVVDVRYVVVRLPNGWRHTYGQLTSTSKRLGHVVLAGDPIGRASGTFFFGLRIGDDYADPAPLLGVLRGRPRLIASDGTPSRPAPPPQPRCAPRAEPSDERTDRIRRVRSSFAAARAF